jgi:hypothetical protein
VRAQASSEQKLALDGDDRGSLSHTGKDLDILFSFLLIYPFNIILRQSLAYCSAAVSMPSSMERSHTIEHASATTTCECT